MRPDGTASEKNRALRLLWLIDSLNLGGAESLVYPFAKGLDPRRIELRVCCLKTLGGNPFESQLAAEGASCVNLSSRNLRDRGAFGRLLRLVRESGIDLIHAHLTDATIWGALASRLARRPLVATLHVAPGSRGWDRPGLRERLMTLALRRRCEAVIAVSQALRDDYVSRGLIDDDRISVVHNGIDLSPFSDDPSRQRASARRRLGLAAEARVVVTVSVLREGKGLEVLLDAAPSVLQAIPEARFVIVGDGPLRHELRERARRRGLDPYVEWTGLHRDVPGLLPCGDLFVLPTLYDAFPTAVLEAMAAGLPILASRVGGIPEIIESPDIGRLVPPRDPEALCRAMVELLSQPAKSSAMAAQGHRRVQDEFSTESWVDRLEQVYARVVGDWWQGPSQSAAGPEDPA